MQDIKADRYAKTDFAPAEWLIRSDRLPLQMQISLPHGVSLTEAQWSEHRGRANKQLLLSELRVRTCARASQSISHSSHLVSQSIRAPALDVSVILIESHFLMRPLEMFQLHRPL